MKKTIVLALLLVASSAIADEGMWLFNRPPRELLKQRYNFDPSPAWLEHLQKSSIRFNNGGSGSFVSPDGLILTNHHVGLDCMQKLSSAAHDYVAIGFHAKTRADEVKCVDLELNVLMSIEDVTQRVNAAVTPGMSAADAQTARRAVMNTIEKESLDKAEVSELFAVTAHFLENVVLQIQVILRAVNCREHRRECLRAIRHPKRVLATAGIRATTWTSAYSAHTRTTSRRRWTTFSVSTQPDRRTAI